MKRAAVVCLMIFLLIPWAWAGQVGMVFDLLSASGAGWGETPLGDAVADALVSQTGADVAVLPAQALKGNLRGGQVTEEEVFRAVDNEMALAVVEVDLATLERLLEDGLTELAVDVETEKLDTEASDSPKFPQISGFFLEVNATGLAGDRVWSLALCSGGEEQVMLCTSMEWLEELGISCQPVEGTPATLFLAHIAQGSLAKGLETGRIRILGTLDDHFMVGIAPLVILILLGVILVFAVSYVKINGRPASKRYGTR